MNALFYWPQQTRKTSISHAICDSRLSIHLKKQNYIQLSVVDEPDGNRQIGMFGDSFTIAPSYYCEGQVCEFHGLGDTRGDDADAMNYISLLIELQNINLLVSQFVYRKSG